MTISQLLKKARSLPKQPGVYIMRDEDGRIIYIGKAVRLRDRVSSYFRENADHEPKVAKMVDTARDFDVIVTDTEFEALALECSLIKQHKPKYNILLKDDKGFSYIRISGDEYPRISAALQKYDDGARYIGPYMSSFAVKRMVETANLAFKLPTCRKKFPEMFGKTRPCLNSHIGRCMALCTGKISRDDYAASVDDAVRFMTRGSDYMLARLKQQMYAASEATEYERAAKYRDSINAIEGVLGGQKVVNVKHGDADAFAFAGDSNCVCAVVLKYRNGVLSDKDEQFLADTSDIAQARREFVAHYYLERTDIPKEIVVDSDFEDRALVEQLLSGKKGSKVTLIAAQKGELAQISNMAYENASDALKRRFNRKTKDSAAVAELASLLALADYPTVIEAYDISNYGEDAVAGMAVFINGLPKKYDYRRFKIKTVEGVDDYASMCEVLLRRVARFDDRRSEGAFARKPDLILLDGGKGHLAAVTAALADTSFSDVPMFGMVKDDSHRTRGIVGVEGEVAVSPRNIAFNLVSKIQNEVHRYSIEYRRASYSKSSVRSSLLQINGVGELTAKKLIQRFKTVAAISGASEVELAEKGDVPRRTAKNIYTYFHSQEQSK